MKKTISIFLVLALIFALAVPAMAEELYTRVAPCKYLRASDFHEGLAAVVQGSVTEDGHLNFVGVGFIDKSGAEVIPCVYQSASDFSEGIAAVSSDNKWGYIDKTGTEVIPFQFEHALNFSGALAPVKLDGKWGYIDRTGSVVVPCRYDSARPFSDGLAGVYVNGKWGFIDESGAEVIPCQFNPSFEADFSEGLCSMKLGLKRIFIDKTGDMAFTFEKYEILHNFSEGLALVGLYDNDASAYRFGFINKAGEEVVPCKYTNAYGFSDGLAAVYANGKWGYIDKTGKEVIPAKYSSADSFSEGLAVVTLDETKRGYIDKSGKEYLLFDAPGTNVYAVHEGLARINELTVITDQFGFIALNIPTAPEKATVGGFSDVYEDDYYADAVLWAVNHDPQITNGVGGSKFGAAGTVTRAQAVTFLWRAAGCPEPQSTTSPFSDVTDTSAWYYKAVLWAAEKNITNGVGDGKFGLDGTLAYDQMLTFMARAAGADASGADWSDKALAWAAGNGLTEGLNVTAKGDCPRCDVVYCLWKQMA